MSRSLPRFSSTAVVETVERWISREQNHVDSSGGLLQDGRVTRACKAAANCRSATDIGGLRTARRLPALVSAAVRMSPQLCGSRGGAQCRA